MRRVLVALPLLSLALAPPARASLAPSVPTYLLEWGTYGSAHQQFDNPLGIAVAPSGDVYVADMNNHRVVAFSPYGTRMAGWGGSGTGNGQFSSPGDVTVDPTGRVLVVDWGNRRVQVFDANGVYLSQFGTLGAGPGQFQAPQGIACDASGAIYVTDQIQNRVQKFTSAGVYVTSWGTAGSGDGQFSFPARIAVDASGHVYVVDMFNHRVQKFTSDGAFVTKWGASGTGDGQFSYPYGIEVDRLGTVYVCDQSNNRMQVFTSGGTFVAKWGVNGTGPGQFFGPACVAVASNGDVYVTDQFNHRVQRFDRAGGGGLPGSMVAVSWFGSSGSGDGQFNTPAGIAVDSQGRIFVSDRGNNRLQRFSAAGVYSSQVGTLGSALGQLDTPYGVAVIGSNVFVAEAGNHRVHRFSTALAPVGTWGTPGTGDGQFNSPTGIAADAGGNLYVVDTGNNRVQKFNGVGTFLAKWGTAGSGPGQFNQPFDVAVDGDGYVYVSDYGNHRVQKFTATGVHVATVYTSDRIPTYLAVDGRGDVQVVENELGVCRVSAISMSGALKSRTTSAGAGFGTLNMAYDMAAGPSGDLYLAEAANNRVIRYVLPPEVRSVSDLPGDQGGAARVRFRRGSNDAADATVPVQRYDLYRRIDAYAPALGARPAAPDQALLDGWEFAASVPAAGDEYYSAVVPTLTDASASSTWMSAFLVRAVTATPAILSTSGTATGFSLDDLAPSVPSPFTAAYLSGATHLHWGVSTAPDFAYFTLHRGADASFTPSLANRIAATADTDHVDVGAAGSWYKLAAVDESGNLSVFAVVGPDQTLDVAPPAPAALAFALEAPTPNPVRGATLTVRFALPAAGAARVELLDVAGRRVSERVLSAATAGRHTVTLGRERALEPGVYLVRLSQGERHATRRVVVVE